MKGKIVHITSGHPLVGVWQGEEDDARAQYTISESGGGGFDVRAVDMYDGEEFDIRNVTWDGKVLTFESLMPSTGRLGVNVFRLLSSTEVEVRFTFTEVGVWKKVLPSKS